MSVSPAICLKAVVDVLLLLHVHVIKLIDWDRIGWTRSAGRESARRTLWKALTRAQGWMHVSCVRTKMEVG